MIGDGSATTRTGLGAMVVSQVGFDAFPSFDTLAPVPEPETWALMAMGLSLVGWAARRR